MGEERKREEVLLVSSNEVVKGGKPFESEMVDVVQGNSIERLNARDAFTHRQDLLDFAVKQCARSEHDVFHDPTDEFGGTCSEDIQECGERTGMIYEKSSEKDRFYPLR